MPSLIEKKHLAGLLTSWKHSKEGKMTPVFYLLTHCINLKIEINLQQVRFWLCSGGSHRGTLSLWIIENSTGPGEQRRLWNSASETKSERDWKPVTLPLYGLEDWYDKHLCDHIRLHVCF